VRETLDIVKVFTDVSQTACARAGERSGVRGGCPIATQPQPQVDP